MNDEKRTILPSTAGSEALRKAAQDLIMPKAMAAFVVATKPPKIEIPKLPSSSERNQYQSAKVLIDRLKLRYESWQREIEDDNLQVAIYALTDGASIRVFSLAEESFHGIAIEGEFDGAPCLFVTHQTNLKLICLARPVTQEEPKRVIGFFTSKGEKDEEV